jgi:aminodeoxychorismate lyase
MDLGAEKFLFHNDELLNVENLKIDFDNRAFRYGDGLFETIRIIDGKPFLLSKHLERLQNDMAVLKMDYEPALNFENITEKIKCLIDKNNITQGGRLRLCVYRKNGGYYTPISNSIGLLLEADSCSENYFELNKKGLDIDVYSDIKKPLNKLSEIKSNNSLIYILASIYKKQQQLDDCILINEENNVSESTNSNVFVVSENKIYTPALDQACLAGTMRKLIIKLARESNYKIYECNLKIEDLLNADELFLTNSIKGIQWVSGFRKKRYYKNVSSSLILKLNEFAHQSI